MEFVIGTINLDNEREEVLKRRISGELTLEQSGKILGITREGVRQIEKKFFQNLKPYQSFFLERISKALINRTTPLYLWRLELEDNWFEGISTFFTQEFSPDSKKTGFFS